MSRGYNLATFVVLLFTFLFFPSTSSGGLSLPLKIIMRDSSQNLTRGQRVERMLRSAKARASSAEGSEPIALKERDYFYVAETLLGSPPVAVNLLIDAGSSLTWTQCKPCNPCFRQTIPFYAPGNSSTFRKLPCSHPLCKGRGVTFQCVNDECVYAEGYGGNGPDLGPTKGVAAFETIRFAPDTTKAFENVIFGCSNSSTNFYSIDDSPISGLMGLGKEAVSFTSQLGHGRFSYCLAPVHSPDHPAIPRTSALTFGDAVPSPPGNDVTRVLATPFVLDGGYNLNLVDISVGHEKLGFAPGTFESKPDKGEEGFIIDSGTGFTILAETGANPYQRVISAFRRYYDSKAGLKKTRALGGLELCYEHPNKFNKFATMTYHFEGADLVVEGKFVNVFDGNSFCVALFPAKGFSLLGAAHQQNIRFIYDLKAGMLKFYSEDCA